MTADYELKLELFGNPEQLKGMLEIVGLYTNDGGKPAYFTFIEVNDNKIDLTNVPEDIISDGSVVVKAFGPYGSYGYLNDVSLFRDLAEAFPNGKFKAEISGSATYETQNLKCELKDGLLNIETFFEANDEELYAWCEYVMEKLPYKKFKKMFKIHGEDFDEDYYKGLLEELGGVFYDDWSDLEFDEFVEILEDSDFETDLEEDEFAEILESKFTELNIMSQGDFSLDYEGGSTNEYVYDPVAKAYVGSAKPMFGQDFNANDIIRAGLKAKGLPSDDDAISNLSVDEAYEALAAGMGFDDEDDGFDDESDDEDDE